MYETLHLAFLKQAENFKKDTALMYKKRGRYRDISWNEFRLNVKNVSLGLTSLGIKKDDKVAVLSENRPEWAYADLGILCIGAINVPIYPTNTEEEVFYILKDTSCETIFVSDKDHLNKILLIKKRLKSLKHIIFFDADKQRIPGVISFKEFIKTGRMLERQKPYLFEELINRPVKEDVATIIYTSGTTGPPRGVMLTHENFLSNIRACFDIFPIGKTDIALSILPLSHVFERMAGYYFMLMKGAQIAYAESFGKVRKNIGEIRPTVMCAVPRFFENVYTKVLDTVIKAPFFKKQFMLWAINVGREFSHEKLDLHRVSPLTLTEYFIANKMVLSYLRKSLGGRIRFFVSGGAPLSKEIAEFFYAAGILILEGYGLTETSPVITVNRIDTFKFGTVGKPIPNVKVRIAEDGEILTKGNHIMKGYFKKPCETKEVVKRGWFHTGDIGRLDRDGFLVIIDRKKDIIITSGGKNVAPQNIENLLRTDRYISNVMVYGDRKKYLTALVVPDFKNIQGYARYKKIDFKNISGLVKEPKIYDFIKRRIDKKSICLASYERIRKFILLDKDFSQKEGELTPTLKVKRKFVSEKFKDLLDSLYAEKP
ncbi:MAG: long-chain fatty acid--CoA ligase [Candidatus Omnitrophica bacterium]|nr:long-chain fatty acid--CoA ligase [Candidatus Omnitrophota bacterium]